VSTSTSTPAGPSTLNISGTSPGVTGSGTSATLVVNAPPQAGFDLTASPSSQTVTAGLATGYTVNVTRTGGFSGEVSLSIAGLPSGAIGTFAPNPIPSSAASSVLTVTTSTTTPGGSSPLNIGGTSPGVTGGSTSAMLVVNAPAGSGFTLSATPSGQQVTRGASTSYTINIVRDAGFTGAVTLSVIGLPDGATATFDFNPAQGASSTLSVTTSSTTPTGGFLLTIGGSSGSLTGSTSTSLRVLSPPDCSQGDCDLDQ
jgi:serine protease AprX